MEMEKGNSGNPVTTIPSAEYFDQPDGHRVLPDLPNSTLSSIGKPAKPILLKENIVLKNKANHPELTPEDSKSILQAALYQTTHAVQDKPQGKPNYWVFVAQNGKPKAAVVKLSESKSHYEIVGWSYLRPETVAQKIKRAEREGGQVLMTKGADSQGAAGLSALSPSIGEDTPDIAGGQAESLPEGPLRNQAAVQRSLRSEPEDYSPLKAVNDKGDPYANVQMSGLADIKIVQMPEMLQLARELMGSLHELKKLPKSRGHFLGTGNGNIRLDPRIFSNPVSAAKTLAHELFHLVDYLPPEEFGIAPPYAGSKTQRNFPKGLRSCDQSPAGKFSALARGD
jgi:hypothetical protein